MCGPDHFCFSTRATVIISYKWQLEPHKNKLTFTSIHTDNRLIKGQKPVVMCENVALEKLLCHLVRDWKLAELTDHFLGLLKLWQQKQDWVKEIGSGIWCRMMCLQKNRSPPQTWFVIYGCWKRTRGDSTFMFLLSRRFNEVVGLHLYYTAHAQILLTQFHLIQKKTCPCEIQLLSFFYSYISNTTLDGLIYQTKPCRR